jgi:hypothetical protein
MDKMAGYKLLCFFHIEKKLTTVIKPHRWGIRELLFFQLQKT